MKNWQFIILLIVVILGFGVLYFQNNKILSYSKSLEYRQIDIYKDTWNTESVLAGIDEIKEKLNASWRVLTNNPTLNDN